MLNLIGRLGKWLWVVLAVLIIVVWRIFVVLNKTTKVESAKVMQGDIIEAVSTSGSVNADKYSSLSFQTPGKVVYVGVTSGETIQKGQKIAQLDTIALNAAYEDALNNYRKYEATAQNILDQVKDHSADETFSQKDTRTTAEVNRDNAYNDLQTARNNLANATIFAPFSGVMDTVSPAAAGVNVGLGAANYTIVDPSSVYFDAEVEETDLPNISVGQKVNVKLDAYPDNVISGNVESIGIVAFTSSTGGNAYHVRISLPENVNEKFRVGMGGDADIIYSTRTNVLKVPSSAVTSDVNSYVWVVQDGRAKKVQVDIGGSSVDEIEIKSGLSVGQEIINNPPSTIAEGQKVSF